MVTVKCSQGQQNLWAVVIIGLIPESICLLSQACNNVFATEIKWQAVNRHYHLYKLFEVKVWTNM